MAYDDLFNLLKKYTEIPGAMGHEKQVQDEFMSDLEPFVSDIEYTNIGNVVAHIPGKGKKVLVFGHADEIAFFVLSITDDGFLRISRNFGNTINFPYTIVGHKALISGDEGQVRGTFVAASAHLLNPKEREQKIDSWKVLVDIGASSREEVEAMSIHVGCPIIWNPITERLGDKVFGKAMDDRFTHVVMIELARRIMKKDLLVDLYLGSTIQEEINRGGAQALAQMGFDTAIALDIGICGDYPLVPKGRMPIALGKGPAIIYRDAASVYNLETIKALRKCADDANIPYQHGVFESYVSDSHAMFAGNTRPNLIATPCRYSHQPNEMMHLEDIENTIRLLYEYVT